METTLTDSRASWTAARVGALGLALASALPCPSDPTRDPLAAGYLASGEPGTSTAPGETGATRPEITGPPVTARLLQGDRPRKGRRRLALQSTDIERALVLLQRSIKPGGSCDAYFRGLGADPEALLTTGEPPYLIYLDRNGFAGDEICAKAQAGEPFSYIFLNPDCPLDGNDTCRVASLLLHEIGHLARRDVTDNEPPEFFAACQVGCLRPGDFH